MSVLGRTRQSSASDPLGLERELTREAWASLTTCRSFTGAAELLGITTSYLERLVFAEYRSLLLEGVSFRTLADVLTEREDVAWRISREVLPPSSVSELEELRRRWQGQELAQEDRGKGDINVRAQVLGVDHRAIHDLVIYGHALNGLSLTAIGEAVGLSRERVRQILKRKFNFEVKQHKKFIELQEEIRTQNLMDAVACWIVEHPGCTLGEAANALRYDASALPLLVPDRIRKLVLEDQSIERKGDTYSTYSREDILGALRHAFALRNPSSSMYAAGNVRPLTGPAYNRYRLTKQIIGPSIPRILQVFGTWRQACDLAGVPSEEPVREFYERRWTDDDLLGFVSDFLIDSESASVDAFVIWLRSEDSRPSYGTIRKQLRLSWSECKRAALRRLRQSWESPDTVELAP
jgi:hypothetical protein